MQGMRLRGAYYVGMHRNTIHSDEMMGQTALKAPSLDIEYAGLRFTDRMR
jgi:hypothetical protein